MMTVVRIGTMMKVHIIFFSRNIPNPWSHFAWNRFFFMNLRTFHCHFFSWIMTMKMFGDIFSESPFEKQARPIVLLLFKWKLSFNTDLRIKNIMKGTKYLLTESTLNTNNLEQEPTLYTYWKKKATLLKNCI